MNRPLKIAAIVGVLALGFLGLSAQITGAEPPAEESRAEQNSRRTVAAARSVLERAAESEEFEGTERNTAAQYGAQAPTEERTQPDREYGSGEFAGLGISENQATQLEAIKESEREQIAEMRATIHDSTRRARWNAIRSEAEALVLEVLTPEQRRARDAAKARVRVARVNQQVRHMNQQLSLSTSQAARIRGILEQWDIDRDAGHRNDHDQEAALTRVREAAEAAMLNVLNPEQQDKLRQMWAQRGR